VLPGFNTNIRHRGVLFHVQTEDSGRAHPHVITHLFHGGTIIASEKRGYADRLDSEDLAGEVRRQMESQHKAMLLRLRRSELDKEIGERLGPELFAPDGDASSLTQPEGVAMPAAPAPAAVAAAPSSVDPDAPLDELVLGWLVGRARRTGPA
jgi:hypothetical protein